MAIYPLGKEGKSSPIHSFMREMARTSTRYPQDAPVQLSVNVTNALDCLVVLLIASYFAPWQTDTLVRSVAQQAYFHNYEGEWFNVQKVLEHEEQSSEAISDKIVEIYGARTYYGNLLPRAEVVLRRIKFKDITKKSNRPIHRGQRIRGYRDKGSRRLPHEFHGDPPIPEQREDRRHLVRHPLLYNPEKTKVRNQNGNMLDSTTLQKEVKQNEYNE